MQEIKQQYRYNQKKKVINTNQEYHIHTPIFTFEKDCKAKFLFIR